MPTSAWTVDIRAVVHPQDVDPLSVVFDAVDDSVAAAAGSMGADQLSQEGLAHPVRLCGEVAVDELDDCRHDAGGESRPYLVVRSP